MRKNARDPTSKEDNMARTDVRASESIRTAAADTTLIRWGAVFGGVVVGLGTLILLASLWFAIAFGSGVTEIGNNLEWYIGISAIVAMFIGGLVAGWLSGIRGFGPGFFNGVSVWGISLIASLLIGVPGVIGAGAAGGGTPTFGIFDEQALLAQGDAFWASFISLLVGALAAAIGGVIGAAFTRPAQLTGRGMVERDYAMPVGASDRGYDLEDERAYDTNALATEDRRERREALRERDDMVPPPPRRGDGWSNTT
jgi:hypothetical protein